VPECVATVSLTSNGMTFTLVVTSDEFRVLDAAQYLDGGPCEAAAIEGDEVQVLTSSMRTVGSCSPWLVPFLVSVVRCRCRCVERTLSMAASISTAAPSTRSLVDEP
jgi:hypothetical protein